MHIIIHVSYIPIIWRNIIYFVSHFFKLQFVHDKMLFTINGNTRLAEFILIFWQIVSEVAKYGGKFCLFRFNFWNFTSKECNDYLYIRTLITLKCMSFFQLIFQPNKFSLLWNLNHAVIGDFWNSNSKEYNDYSYIRELIILKCMSFFTAGS